MNLLTKAAICTILFSFVGFAQNRSDEQGVPHDKPLPLRVQMEVREAWLRKRLGEILPAIMKRHGIEMWIVVNEEFKSDPVTEYIVPPIPIVGRRDLFVFAANGDKLDRFAFIRYDEERLKNHYTLMMPPRDKFGEAIRKLVDERRPKTIALNFGGTRGQQSGLSHDAYNFLAEALGPENEKKFVSAAEMLTEFLGTRLPDELEHYHTAVAITDAITRRALSNEVITPGKTTVGDVRWWMMQQVANLGLGIWFQPDLRVQRRAADTGTTQQFLSTAQESLTLERGDLIHVDFGVIYMGFSTDWQKHAYILNDGETSAPEGLTKALRNTNLLQDIIFRIARTGMTGSEIYEASMAEAKKENLDAMIYSHPVGAQGHGLGPSIDFRDNIGGGGNRVLPGSYMSIELNTSTMVPEWSGQKVTIMAEDDAYMTEEGYKFFRPRQTELYLIR